MPRAIASWQGSDRDEPDDPEPTTITAPTEVPDAIVRTTEPAPVAVDREMDAGALCGRWLTSVRAGVELEPDARRALVAMAARAGAAVDQLCGPFVPSAHEALPTAGESTPPGTVVPPTVSTIDSTDIPTPDAPPPTPTDDGTPKATPTLPSEANGNGPPVQEPSPVDEGNDASTHGTPNANADANANGDANAHGGNPNANSNASGATRQRPPATAATRVPATRNGNGNARQRLSSATRRTSCKESGAPHDLSNVMRTGRAHSGRAMGVDGVTDNVLA